MPGNAAAGLRHRSWAWTPQHIRASPSSAPRAPRARVVDVRIDNDCRCTGRSASGPPQRQSSSGVAPCLRVLCAHSRAREPSDAVRGKAPSQTMSPHADARAHTAPARARIQAAAPLGCALPARLSRLSRRSRTQARRGSTPGPTACGRQMLRRPSTLHGATTSSASYIVEHLACLSVAKRREVRVGENGSYPSGGKSESEKMAAAGGVRAALPAEPMPPAAAVHAPPKCPPPARRSWAPAPRSARARAPPPSSPPATTCTPGPEPLGTPAGRACAAASRAAPIIGALAGIAMAPAKRLDDSATLLVPLSAMAAAPVSRCGGDGSGGGSAPTPASICTTPSPPDPPPLTAIALSRCQSGAPSPDWPMTACAGVAGAHSAG